MKNDENENGRVEGPYAHMTDIPPTTHDRTLIFEHRDHELYLMLLTVSTYIINIRSQLKPTGQMESKMKYTNIQIKGPVQL